MSVSTTADERLKAASRHLKAAQDELNLVLFDEEMWGHGDYSKEFTEELFDMLTQIRRLREVFRGTRYA